MVVVTAPERNLAHCALIQAGYAGSLFGLGLLKASVTSETSLQPTLTSHPLPTVPALAQNSESP